MTSVLIFVPAYKNQMTGTTWLATLNVIQTLDRAGISWGGSSISNPDIEWVRNFAITHWYDHLPHYSHILFVDDDMGFMGSLITDMLAFGEPVVGGIYCKKTMERQWAVSGLPQPQQRGPFIEVEGLGCGVFMIRRDAIVTMLEKMPHLIDTRPNTLDSDLFRDIGMKRFLRPFDCIFDDKRGKVSEDISFGRRWRQCGGQVWGAMHHEIVHVGPYEFKDTYQTWAQGEKAKAEAQLMAKVQANEYLKLNPGLKTKLCKHGAFIYNPNDTFIGRSLEAYGEWSEFEIDFLRRFIQAGDTVIDVGANIGTHTAPFSRLVEKLGKVFAFEAYPRLEKILEQNIKLNNLGNVIWDNKVIGRECLKAHFNDIPADDVVCNFGNFPLRDDGGEKLTVDMITLDSFAVDLDSVTLIKIDVEGMECDVIWGAMATIEKHKPVLYLDFGDEGDGQSVWETLEQIGYKAYWHFGPFFHANNFAKNQINIWTGHHMLGANLVAMPEPHVEFDARLADLQPFTGPEDNWKAAMERMAKARGAVVQFGQAAE